MTYPTRRQWATEQSEELHKIPCPVCRSKTHGLLISPDGYVLAYCQKVKRDVKIARIAIPKHFAPEEVEFPLYTDAQGNEHEEY